jgi:hypothetical protein
VSLPSLECSCQVSGGPAAGVLMQTPLSSNLQVASPTQSGQLRSTARSASSLFPRATAASIVARPAAFLDSVLTVTLDALAVRLLERFPLSGVQGT